MIHMLTNTLSRRTIFFASFVTLAVVGFVGSAYATHSWAGYHWARTGNPFTVKLGNNVTSAWSSYLATTSIDWSASAVLDTSIVTGQGGRNCRATSGRVEVCNAKYGKNGWLGIASVWANGTHITQATVKLNDTYFNTARYNTPAWRNLVMCQEVGHTIGLDHQDENFTNPNLGTCMDYTNDPSTNQHPNAHDYEELVIIYGHLDTVSTLAASPVSVADDIGTDLDPASWGKVVQRDARGRPSKYEKDLGRGRRLFTFVVWADDEE